MKFLLIRDLENCYKMAQEIKATKPNYDIIIEPVFTVERVSNPLFSYLEQNPQIEKIGKDYNQKYAIIITSHNAIFALNDNLISRNAIIFTISKKIAKSLQEIGYLNIIISEEENARSLLLLLQKLFINIQENNKNTNIYNLDINYRFFYFRGSEITIDFRVILANFCDIKPIEDVLSYKIIAKQDFSCSFKNIVNQYLLQNRNDIDFLIPIFSINSGRIFHQLLAKNDFFNYFKNQKLLCISNNIKDFMQDCGFTNLI